MVTAQQIDERSEPFKLRLASDRGRFNYGWLRTAHTFSFGSYYDIDHMGFRTLRVINEDRVEPGQGFPSHPHRNVELLSYVLDGVLEHSDSTGQVQTLRRGDIQLMSAGSGLTHSEKNHSQDAPLHFMQIWIRSAEMDSEPSYQRAHFDDAAKRNQLCLIGSGDGRLGSLRLQQDVAIYASKLAQGEQLNLELSSGRHAWVQLAGGCIEANGQKLCHGDGCGFSGFSAIDIKAGEDSELLVFDLA